VAIRRIAQSVIDDLIARLKPRLSNALRGQRDRTRRSHHQVAANVNWTRTIRENLGGYDPQTGKLVVERIAFMARKRRALPWTVILCVDQSGSMVESLIHSAVTASILTGLPGVRVKMVLFDTAVVDVSDQLDDPLELLMTAQLGGGTNIGKAVQYCEQLVEDPTRTVFALVSDFFEGPSPKALYAAVARLSEARVVLAGIAALGASGDPSYDREIAQGLAAQGMEVGAMSPDGFAEWFAAQLS
ncbi:UNVERIFIED_CONTAM: hypothetical protein GTU68_021478, partial [Idotea baltica]|nr:hypothetical protein [Idotea baltica]